MPKRVKVNGYAGIYYRMADRIGGRGQEKVYYVVFKKNGKVTEAKAGRQYADAMTPAKAARFRSNLIEGREQTNQARREAEKKAQAAEDNRYTISKLWTEYKAAKPNLKGIVTDQNRFGNYIEPTFGNKEPSTLLPLDVDRLRLKLLKKRTPGTVKNVLELLRRIINFGVKKQLCEGIGFIIEMPEVNNIKTEDLSPDQLKRLLDAIEADYHDHAGDMMLMALYTGMRRGELFKLQWKHIDFQKGFITLVDPKGGPDQKIPLNDAAREVLENHIETDDSPYVFPGHGGKQRTDINKAVGKIKKAAGLRKSFRALHGLRHVYASMQSPAAAR